MTYRILVTGSRAWTDRAAVVRALEVLVMHGIKQGEDVVVIHGDCPTGVDYMTAQFCFDNGVEVEAYPADWSIGRHAGPVRNQQMVDLGADICVAFPMGGSRGTLDCMKRAREAGIEIIDLGK